MAEDKPGTEFFEDLWRKDVWSFETDPFEQARFTHELKLVQDRHYGRALELGCGAGAFTRLFAPLCDRVLAIDLAPAAIERARALGLPDVEFRTGNAMEHEAWATDGPWDLIVINDTIYYLGWRYSFFEVAWFAHQMKAALAPGGRLLMANSTGDEGGDYLMLPFVTFTYRDLLRNVGLRLEREDRFVGTRNGVAFTVIETLFSRDG
jgi:predicted TPR repeat methyltransferase